MPQDKMACLIGELVDGELPADGHGLWLGLDQVVVPVGDGHVLVDVARVQDVVPGRRHRHLEVEVRTVTFGLGQDLHVLSDLIFRA